MKIKLFVAREIQYFEFGIFSFNSYVYYLTRGFIASTRAFKVGLSPSKKLCVINDEKCFLIHLKSSFCSQDI